MLEIIEKSLLLLYFLIFWMRKIVMISWNLSEFMKTREMCLKNCKLNSQDMSWKDRSFEVSIATIVVGHWELQIGYCCSSIQARIHVRRVVAALPSKRSTRRIFSPLSPSQTGGFFSISPTVFRSNLWSRNVTDSKGATVNWNWHQ